MATGLAVDEETVRNRLSHMNEEGFLQGWQLIINPILLGRMAAVVELGVNDKGSKTEVISELSLLDGVTLIEDFYGNDLAIHILYDEKDTLMRKVKLMAYITGCMTPNWWNLGFPPCKLTPTKTEWRIIHALRMNARGRLSDVAESLKLSNRTVKRHMMHMIEGNAFYLDPLLDVGKVGGVRGRFLIVCEPEKKPEIDAKALEKLNRIISTHTAPRECSLFMVQCANTSEVQDISHWLEKLEGVKDVRTNIDVEHIHVNEWLAREIERQL